MSAPERLMCLGECGYPLTSPLARARGYGHRCWAKLPAATQAAITAEIRPPRPPAKPRTTKTTRRTAATVGQLELTDDPTTERTCWACRGSGVRHAPDPADTEFEAEDLCTVCEGSGVADSAGGPIVREPWTEETSG